MSKFWLIGGLLLLIGDQQPRRPSHEHRRDKEPHMYYRDDRGVKQDACRDEKGVYRCEKN